ncbi:ribonuclease H-like domain-containing protein [Tanacetum coccineum]
MRPILFSPLCQPNNLHRPNSHPWHNRTTLLPHTFNVGTLQDPAPTAWNMDTAIQVLFRCDSRGDLYPVTASSHIPHVFFVSQHTWHQRLGHPGGEVLRRLVSSNFISYNKENSLVLCYPCQLGKHVWLPFGSSCIKYVVEILERAHMVTCNPSRIPIDTESKLRADGDPVSDPTLYRSLAGSLQYLTFTRLDISYAVQQLFSSSTKDLVAYLDADWAGCPTTQRSTSCYYVFLGNNLLSWSSKRQPTLSRSSAKAEYRSVANAVAETCWLRNLLCELHTPLSSATLVYCDNVSAMYLSCNPVQLQRTKHIEIDIHFDCDLVAARQARASRYQFADVFTKGLPSDLFEEFQSSLNDNNMKNPRQAVRGVQVGSKLGSKVQIKSSKQVYRPVFKRNGASSCGKKKQRDSKSSVKGANSDMVSSVHETSSEAFGSLNTTPLATRFNDLERKMLNGKLVLVYDDGKQLKKVDDSFNADSDSVVDEVHNETVIFMA